MKDYIEERAVDLALSTPVIPYPILWNFYYPDVVVSMEIHPIPEN